MSRPRRMLTFTTASGFREVYRQYACRYRHTAIGNLTRGRLKGDKCVNVDIVRGWR
jgi:hypothetical protein